tara:strand:+ start:42 stop:422 length:381 start_codon:yes stop_codon:yes gene_type:complete
MATEILVNDGGAPARILPFVAHHALSGGNIVEMETTGKVKKCADTASQKWIGYSLVDAAADGPANIVTGHGVILNALCTGTVASGAALEIDAADGILVAGVTPGEVVAVAMGSQGAVLGYVKVLTR